MSIQTLYTAATGMESLQTKLDVIANNLANVNTTSFKRDRANFEDLFYRQIKLPGATDAAGRQRSCATTDRNMIEVAGNIGSDSYVYFAWNLAGKCTKMEVENGSFMHPKK